MTGANFDQSKCSAMLINVRCTSTTDLTLIRYIYYELFSFDPFKKRCGPVKKSDYGKRAEWLNRGGGDGPDAGNGHQSARYFVLASTRRYLLVEIRDLAVEAGEQV